MDLVGDKNNVTVTIDDSEGDSEPTILNYSVILDGNRHFSIDIPWVTTSEEGVTSFNYNSPAIVTVTYQAVLNNEAAIQTDIQNNATLTWTGNSTGSSDKETVQTYALAIKKVNKDGAALNGATFKLTNAETKQEIKVKLVTDNNIDGNVYVVDPNGNDIITSPVSGLIVIKGVDNVNYTLTETTAPDGYNLLETPTTVTPVEVSNTTTTIYLDENGNVTNTETNTTVVIDSGNIHAKAYVIVNMAGSELPSTGGMGTTVIYILGAALVLGAGIVLVVRRRMSADR